MTWQQGPLRGGKKENESRTCCMLHRLLFSWKPAARDHVWSGRMTNSFFFSYLVFSIDLKTNLHQK
jgi:hypothetical protein